MNDKTDVVGEAYGFFRCDTPKEEIDRIAGGIIDSLKKEESMEQIVSGRLETIYPLKLSLSDIDNREYGADKELTALAKDAYHADAGLNYVLGATYRGKTNEETAEVVADVLDQFALSHLYTDGEDFFGDIVYKNEEGAYVFAD